MSAASLTDEHYRILRAAADRRLRTNRAARWTIAGEARPDRKSRERLKARGLIDYPQIEPAAPKMAGLAWDFGRLVLTDKGREALAARPS